MKKLCAALAMVSFLTLAPSSTLAQFGKNIVNWRDETPKFYSSAHFDVWYYGLDLKESAQQEHFRKFLENLEGAYGWLSSEKVFGHAIEDRIAIIVYATHSGFEANLIAPFLPEGVGAFAEPSRKRVVTKEDLLPQLKREANVHELVHQFQFDSRSAGLIERLSGVGQLPLWFVEGGAEFIAGTYDPHTRDDIRRRVEREMGANPRKDLPTWNKLNSDKFNPYLAGAMIHEFLQEKYGIGVAFHVKGIKKKASKLGRLIYELTEGRMDDPGKDPRKFDQEFRRYWSGLYERDRIDRPNPYDETDNFRGRSIAPYGNPYPMLSPALSPDGKQLACFTIGKNGVTLVVFPVPEEQVFKKEENDAEKKPVKVKNLTPWLPPVPVEYYIVQGFETWPFNGFDLAWSKDNRLAFFARKNRDHALFIIDAQKPKKIQKVIEVPLDQSFSPSWGPASDKIYFSAAKNITRDIYVVDVETNELKNLTDDPRFDTAPVVSPDGKQIAYVGQDGDFQHLFMLDLATGEKKQLTYGRFNDNSPSWSDDGKLLVYTSDEIGQIWNVHALNLESMTVRQWTNFFGGAETPVFARGDNSKVYCVVYHDDAEYKGFIYPNFEIFEVTLKNPIAEYAVSRNAADETMDFSFAPERNLFKLELDPQQVFNPDKTPEKWHSFGGTTYLGVDPWGVFGSTWAKWSNMLETKHRFLRAASYGSSFQMFDYVYINAERRWQWAYQASHLRYPFYYQFYDVALGKPSQNIINAALINNDFVGFFADYPFNKFKRLELFAQANRQNFDFGGLGDLIQASPDLFSANDLQMFQFLRDSGGYNLALGAAYVRDTVIYSYQTQGPLNGSAFRVQVEAAPPLGQDFQKYVSLGVDWRTYHRIGSRTLFASRIAAQGNSRPNGNFVLLGGPDTLRGYSYGSLVGNQVAYGSLELRFPLLDALVLPGGIGLGPFRGFLFADAGFAKFSNGNLPVQKGYSYGAGVQFLPFSFVWSNVEGRWTQGFYLSFNW